MKNGYYLSIYTSINPVAYYYDIPLRHDHNMALWQLSDRKVELIRYWEFERITGIKKHGKSFYSKEDAVNFINVLLSPLELNIDDMNAIWGTPELNRGSSSKNEKEVCTHSLYHLYSSLFSDTEKLRQNNIIALALDAGPDNIQEHDAWFKKFYVGAYVEKGIINLFSISSPACMWSQLTAVTGLEEGSLMALGSATRGKLFYNEYFNINFSISEFGDTYKAQDYVIRLADYVNNLTEKNVGKEIECWDYRFSEQENRISMMVKVLQEQSIKMVINEVKKIVQRYHVNTERAVLSISGGYGLNCPTNMALMKEFKFKSFFSVPCISDCGLSLGIGLYEFSNRKKDFIFKLRNSYYGDVDNQINVLKKYSNFISNTSKFNEKIFINDIVENPVIWFYGNAEIGPRALGHRSILGDPRSSETKEKINSIKQRQWWRPVAPIILFEHLDEWFQENYESEYMLMTYKIQEDKADKVPGIVHLDGTARVQTVNKENAILYNLLQTFYKNTGVPMLCNTSLNDKQEPIINKISEMINFALRKNIKIAYINGIRVEFKNHNEFKEISPEVRFIWYNQNVKETQINPYKLNYEEIEYYLYNPQLQMYDIKKREEAILVKELIKRLKV